MMTSVLNLFAGEMGQRIGWALVHFVWQGTVVALLLAGLLHALRRRSAQTRWLVSCAALGLMVLLPVVTAIAVRTPGEKSAPGVLSVSRVAAGAVVPAGAEVQTVPSVSVVAKLSAPTAGVVWNGSETKIMAQRLPWYGQVVVEIRAALPWLPAVWLISVLILSIWHLGGWFQTLVLRRRETKPVSDAVAALLAQLSERLKISRPVRVLVSAVALTPLVLGWLRPVVLLPATMLTGLTREQLAVVLAHELAHVRRYDCLVRLIQAVVETLLFYHPAVWWVSRRISEESELCCDELAVAISGDRQSYAATLVRVAELNRERPPLAVAASGGSLVRRVRHILGRPETGCDVRSTWLAGMILLAMLVAGGAITAGCLGEQGAGQSEAVPAIAAKESATLPPTEVKQATEHPTIDGKQWLQYHMAADPQQHGAWGNWYGNELGIMKVRPTDVDLPQFTGDKPLFARWRTPMVKAGFLWLALDQSKKGGAYDRLYIDDNCDGKLSDKTAVVGANGSNGSGGIGTRFGPIKISFPGDDGPITYHLNITYDPKAEGAPRLEASAACWYEGRVKVGGRERRCLVCDCSANGAFNDTGFDWPKIDRIRIENFRKGPLGIETAYLDTLFTGQYMQIDEKFYRMEIARDGGWIKFSDVDKNSLARVRVTKPKDGFGGLGLCGKTGWLHLNPDADGVILVPPGRYSVWFWAEKDRPDAGGRMWYMIGGFAPFEKAFDVGPGGEVTLPVGEPAQANLKMTRTNDTHNFTVELIGRMGEPVTFGPKDGLPTPPVILRIKNEGGDYNQALHFKYGEAGCLPLSWREPTSVAGPFNATVEVPGPFKFETNPVKIE